MSDRGIIKWAPFSSVINGDILLKEIHEEKSRIIKPTLSEEQIQELEDKILEKYNNKTLVTIFFYKSEHIYILKGIISKINTATKEITVNNQKVIFFSNIIRII